MYFLCARHCSEHLTHRNTLDFDNNPIKGVPVRLYKVPKVTIGPLSRGAMM